MLVAGIPSRFGLFSNKLIFYQVSPRERRPCSFVSPTPSALPGSSYTLRPSTMHFKLSLDPRTNQPVRQS